MAFIPDGVKDTLCKESEQKDKVTASLKKLYRSYGYRKIETPTFEYYDTFCEIKNTINKDKTLKIIDSNGKILLLRPDVTTPIVRSVLSNYNDKKNYLKFYYNMNVFRKSESSSYSKKEMTQAGVEFIGGDKEFCDSEVISLAILSLKNQSQSQSFQVDIGDTDYVRGLIRDIDDKEQIKRIIANKNMIALSDFLSRLDIKGNVKKALEKLPYLYGTMDTIKKEAIICNKETQRAMDSLQYIYDALKLCGLEEHVSFDLAMSQELNYYTGVIFKGYMEGYGKPVLSGGRYGNLLEESDGGFGGVGFGIDVDGLLSCIDEKESIKSDYVVIGSDMKDIIEKSSELRNQGYVVEGLLKSMNYHGLKGEIIDTDKR